MSRWEFKIRRWRKPHDRGIQTGRKVLKVHFSKNLPKCKSSGRKILKKPEKVSGKPS